MSVLGGYTDGAWSLVCLLPSPLTSWHMFPRLPGQQRLLHLLRLSSPLCVKSLGSSSPFATGKRHRVLQEKRVLMQVGCIFLPAQP